MFLSSVLSHPDALGASVVRGTACCHGTISIRVFRNCVGTCKVNIEESKNLHNCDLTVSHINMKGVESLKYQLTLDTYSYIHMKHSELARE